MTDRVLTPDELRKMADEGARAYRVEFDPAGEPVIVGPHGLTRGAATENATLSWCRVLNLAYAAGLRALADHQEGLERSRDEYKAAWEQATRLDMKRRQQIAELQAMVTRLSGPEPHVKCDFDAVKLEQRAQEAERQRDEARTQRDIAVSVLQRARDVSREQAARCKNAERRLVDEAESLAAEARACEEAIRQATGEQK